MDPYITKQSYKSFLLLVSIALNTSPISMTTSWHELQQLIKYKSNIRYLFNVFRVSFIAEDKKKLPPGQHLALGQPPESIPQTIL